MFGWVVASSNRERFSIKPQRKPREGIKKVLDKYRNERTFYFQWRKRAVENAGRRHSVWYQHHHICSCSTATGKITIIHIRKFHLFFSSSTPKESTQTLSPRERKDNRKKGFDRIEWKIILKKPIG